MNLRRPSKISEKRAQSLETNPELLASKGASNYCALLHSRAYIAGSTACGRAAQLHTTQIFWIIYLSSAGQRAVLQLQLCWARYLHAVFTAKNSSGALQLLPKGPGEQPQRQALPQQEGPELHWKARVGRDAQQETYLQPRSNSRPPI